MLLADQGVSGATGLPIIGTDEEDIATVDNVLMSPEGMAEALIVEEGAVFGLGGDEVRFDFARADFNRDDEGDEPRVSISMDEEALENVEAWEREAMSETWLASDIDGAEAGLSDTDETVQITDVILSEDGQAEFLIVESGLFGLGGEARRVDFDALQVAEGDGSMQLDMTLQEFEQSALWR